MGPVSGGEKGVSLEGKFSFLPGTGRQEEINTCLAAISWVKRVLGDTDCVHSLIFFHSFIHLLFLVVLSCM